MTFSDLLTRAQSLKDEEIRRDPEIAAAYWTVMGGGRLPRHSCRGPFYLGAPQICQHCGILMAEAKITQTTEGRRCDWVPTKESEQPCAVSDPIPPLLEAGEELRKKVAEKGQEHAKSVEAMLDFISYVLDTPRDRFFTFLGALIGARK